MADPEIIVFAGCVNTKGPVFKVQLHCIVSPGRVLKHLNSCSITDSDSPVVVGVPNVPQRAESAGYCVSRVWSKSYVNYFGLST